jgi:hypothetical protein
MIFDNAKTITFNGKSVKKLELNGEKIWEAVSFKNWVPFSIDTDKSIFNGKGWVEKIRLSSSGVTKDSSYASTTGYIPAKPSSVIRIAGFNWLDSGNQSANYVCSYDENFNFVSAVNCAGTYGGGTVSGDSEVAVVTMNATSSIAYVRVSGAWSVVGGPCDAMIVTVDEEIPI